MDQSDNVTRQRRRFPRVMAPVFFRSPRILSPRRRVSDISPTGVRIFSDEYLKVGRRLEIELFLPSGLSVEAIVRVVWINECAPEFDSNYDVGLEFLQLSPSVAMDELKSVLKYSADSGER